MVAPKQCMRCGKDDHDKIDCPVPSCPPGIEIADYLKTHTELWMHYGTLKEKQRINKEKAWADDKVARSSQRRGVGSSVRSPTQDYSTHGPSDQAPTAQVPASAHWNQDATIRRGGYVEGGRLTNAPRSTAGNTNRGRGGTARGPAHSTWSTPLPDPRTSAVIRGDSAAFVPSTDPSSNQSVPITLTRSSAGQPTTQRVRPEQQSESIPQCSTSEGSQSTQLSAADVEQAKEELGSLKPPLNLEFRLPDSMFIENMRRHLKFVPPSICTLSADTQKPKSMDSRKDNTAMLKGIKEDLKYPKRIEYQNLEGADTLTNHFEIKSLPSEIFYYSVQGIPSTESTAKKRVIMETLIQKLDVLRGGSSNFVHDGTDSIFTWDKEFLNPQTVIVPATITTRAAAGTARAGGRRIVNLHLTIASVCTLNTSLLGVTRNNVQQAVAHYAAAGANVPPEHNLDIITRAVNLILMKSALLPLHQGGGYETFSVSSNKLYLKKYYKSIGDVFVAHIGFFFTVKPQLHNPLLNFNTTTSVFYNPMLVSEFIRRSQNMPVLQLSRLLRGVRVVVLYGPYLKEKKFTLDVPTGVAHSRYDRYVRSIESVGEKCNQQMITTHNKDDSTKTQTLFRYFDTTHRDKEDFRMDPELRAIEVRGGAWYSSEHLWILPYQQYKSQLAPNLVQSMLEIAARPANENRALIENGLKSLNAHGSRPSPVATSSQTKLNPAIFSIKNLQMIHPAIRFRSSNADITPKSGSWNLARDAYLRPQNNGIRHCVRYLRNSRLNRQYPSRLTGGPESFHEYFAANVAQNHLYLGQPIVVECDFSSATFSSTPFRQQLAGTTDNDLVVAFGGGDSVEYARFRIAMDRLYGLKALYLKKAAAMWFKNAPIDSYFGNLALKINVKYAGQYNHYATSGYPKRFGEGTTMLLGADVTHPGRGAGEKGRSLAALVGTLDTKMVSYGGSARMQTKAGASEMIDGLKSMTMERIRAWQNSNSSAKLQNVIYFRDGVSASQYDTVLRVEVAAITEAFHECQINAKLTVIVATKRHHTRFYPTLVDLRSSNKGKNCLPGTCVDNTVTNPFVRDFFLQAQACYGLSATARPTHYFVLRDDMQWTIPELRDFVMALCFTYARSTTSVSYATPAYYADRLCDRLRAYFHEELAGRSNDWETTWNLPNAGPRDGENPWHENLANTMFWL